MSARSIVDFRQLLHQNPELSGAESATAARIVKRLEGCEPATIYTGVGGHGVVSVFEGRDPGTTVVLRCELDALPILEANSFAYKSVVPGVSHKCGHDGHMAMLIGVAEELHRRPPKSGKVALLFQPSEENGKGGPRVVADDSFMGLHPDFVFALHNWPGRPFGELGIRSGAMTCGSVGLEAVLEGSSAHAANPEEGVSPRNALAELLTSLPSLGLGAEGINLVTISHASLGEPGFSFSPGAATLRAVLRSDGADRLGWLRSEAEAQLNACATRNQLSLSVSWHDDFPVGMNDPEAAKVMTESARSSGISVDVLPDPIRPSEDFAHYSERYRSAFAVLGAGDVPALHNEHYDFPDDLTEIGVKIYVGIISTLNGF